MTTLKSYIEELLKDCSFVNYTSDPDEIRKEIETAIGYGAAFERARILELLQSGPDCYCQYEEFCNGCIGRTAAEWLEITFKEMDEEK